MKDNITYITELNQEEVCQMQKSSTGMSSGKNFKEALSGFLKDNLEKKESLDSKK